MTHFITITPSLTTIRPRTLVRHTNRSDYLLFCLKVYFFFKIWRPFQKAKPHPSQLSINNIDIYEIEWTVICLDQVGRTGERPNQSKKLKRCLRTTSSYKNGNMNIRAALSNAHDKCLRSFSRLMHHPITNLLISQIEHTGCRSIC